MLLFTVFRGTKLSQSKEEVNSTQSQHSFSRKQLAHVATNNHELHMAEIFKELEYWKKNISQLCWYNYKDLNNY